MDRRYPTPAWWLLILVAALSGCGRDDIQVYRVAKETPSELASKSQDSENGAGQEDSALPHVEWKLPTGWQERPPGSMRVASFAIEGKDGQTADVAITPLPGVTGRELDLVNLWREQVLLGPVTESEMTKQSQPVPIGADQGTLFDMVSEKPVADAKSPRRILVAMMTKEGTSWFFKMTGDASLVDDQKPAFAQFLKSIVLQAPPEPIQFAKAPHSFSTNAKRTPRENSDKPSWIVPAGWQEVPGGQMLVAKFVIAGNNGSKAELNVAALGGGLLANVNRWRGQLGLEEVGESDLGSQVQSFEVAGGKATLVDMKGVDARTGQKARLIGAIVPQGDQTWYYKLMGDEQIVEREKEAFKGFVQTAKYPNAS